MASTAKKATAAPTMSSSSSSSLPGLITAVSKNLVAVAPLQTSSDSTANTSSTLRIFLYHDGLLQTTLTSNTSQLTSGATDVTSTTITASSIQKLLFLNESQEQVEDQDGEASALVAVSTHAIIIWDLKRGVVAQTINVSPMIILDSHTSHQHDLYVLVQHSEHQSYHNKTVLYQYSSSTAGRFSPPYQLSRKIKVKHAHLFAITDSYIVTTHKQSKVRILSTSTGQVVHKKVSLPSLSSSSSISIVALETATDATAATAMVLFDNGTIAKVNLQDGTTQSWASATMISTATSLRPSLECGNASEEWLLMNGQQIVHPNGNNSKEPQFLLYGTNLDAGVVRTHQILPNHVWAILCQHGSYQVQVGPTNGADEPFAWKDSTSTASSARSQSDAATRNRSTSSNSGAAILGPAQAGGVARVRDDIETPPPNKKAKPSDSEADMEMDANNGDGDDDGVKENDTIAARLARMKEILDEDDAAEEAKAQEFATKVAKFQPKKATTESLTKLVQQGLSDDAMLELCLTVRDPIVLQETCANLSRDEIAALVSAITVRLAQKPSRADSLCLWLKVLLQTRQIPLSVLIPLQNLIQERIEVFPMLLKLEGRLSMLTNSL